MNNRIFQYRYVVRAPLSKVTQLFFDPQALALMMPPPLSVRFLSLPDRLAPQSSMTMSIGVGPWRIRWKAVFTAVEAARFVDEQTEGPFARWIHTHDFVAVSTTETEIRDRIEGAFGTRRLLCGLLWAGLPLLFVFRRWRTPRLLARRR